MPHATREMHDACPAACRAHPPASGTPEHALMLDVMALDAVASGWAASMHAPERDMARAAASGEAPASPVLARLDVRPAV